MHVVLLELLKAQSNYDEKLKASHPSEQAMFALTWDIDELDKLTTEGRNLHVDIVTALDTLKKPETEHQQLNIPRKVDSIRKRCVEMIKRTTRFRRKQATHMFVLMISSEVRDKKPYALPVQCIPCAGLKKQGDLRRIVNELLREMVAHKMNVAGILSTCC